MRLKLASSAMIPALALSSMLLAACAREHAPVSSDSARGARQDTLRHSQPASASTTATPATPSAVSGAPSADTGGSKVWRASARDVGPVTFGMTVARAARATGGTLARPPQGSCGFVSMRNAPRGARFMVSYDTVVRVDVDSASIATDAGARVGMREDSVQHLYANRLRVTPHKYVAGGHYLIFIPGAPADTTHQLIFETDGDRVTRYRAGLAPFVGNVEGCG